MKPSNDMRQDLQPGPSKETRDPLDLLAEQAATSEKVELQTEGETEQEAPGMSNAACCMMAGEMVRDTLCSLAGLKSPLVTLASAKLTPVAEAIGAVFDKYGVNLAGAAGNYMIEIKAVMMTVPMILACRVALLAEMKDLKAIEATTPSSAAPGVLQAVSIDALG